MHYNAVQHLYDSVFFSNNVLISYRIVPFTSYYVLMFRLGIATGARTVGYKSFRNQSYNVFNAHQ